MITEQLEALIGRLVNNTFDRTYVSKVVKVYANGNCDVVPEDGVLKGNGISNCEFFGVAGLVQTPVVGSKVLLQFSGGKASKPVCTAYKGSVVKQVFNGGTQPVARKDDATNGGYLLWAPVALTLQYFGPDEYLKGFAAWQALVQSTDPNAVFLELAGIIAEGNSKWLT